MYDEEGPSRRAQHEVGVGPRIPAVDLVGEAGEDAGWLPGALGGSRAPLHAGRDLPRQHRLQLQGLAQLDENILKNKAYFS